MPCILRIINKNFSFLRRLKHERCTIRKSNTAVWASYNHPCSIVLHNTFISLTSSTISTLTCLRFCFASTSSRFTTSFLLLCLAISFLKQNSAFSICSSSLQSIVYVCWSQFKLRSLSKKGCMVASGDRCQGLCIYIYIYPSN